MTVVYLGLAGLNLHLGGLTARFLKGSKQITMEQCIGVS